MTLDEKLDLIKQAGIVLDRVEIMKEILAIASQKARTIKTTNAFTEALASLTAEDIASVTAKVLDKYLKLAQSQFELKRTEELTQEMVEKKHGAKAAEKIMRTLKYRWVAVLSGTWERSCPDCKARHGMEKTMRYWRTHGTPRTGATRCGQYCYCDLLPVDDGAAT